jgi:hypothetical protein
MKYALCYILLLNYDERLTISVVCLLFERQSFLHRQPGVFHLHLLLICHEVAVPAVILAQVLAIITCDWNQCAVCLVFAHSLERQSLFERPPALYVTSIVTLDP